jgi:hypothetical protein
LGLPSHFLVVDIDPFLKLIIELILVIWISILLP